MLSRPIPPSRPRRQAAPPRAGFTIIELLVVVAVLAILVAILLPALGKARETARATVCRSNLQQSILAFTFYAGDYKVIPGAYWQGPRNLDWSGRNNAVYLANPNAYRHPLETSVLLEYYGRTDRVMECPSAKREANRFFDYTMIIRMAGARLDLQWRVNYPSNPAYGASARVNLPAIPLLMEEHDLFFNRSYDDGSFAGRDQVSTRHGGRESGSAAGGLGGGGHIGYLDGSCRIFRPPAGSNDRLEENADLKANQLRMVKIRTQAWPLFESDASEFGWANRSRN